MQPADNYFSQWAKIAVTSLLNYEVRCDTVRFGTSYFLMWHFILCDWMLLNRFLNHGFWMTIRDLLSVNGGVLGDVFPGYILCFMNMPMDWIVHVCTHSLYCGVWAILITSYWPQSRARNVSPSVWSGLWRRNKKSQNKNIICESIDVMVT